VPASLLRPCLRSRSSFLSFPSFPLRAQYIDFTVQPGASFTHAVPPGMSTVFCYVYSGAGTFGAERRPSSDGDMLVMSPDGTQLTFACPDSSGGGASAPLCFLLLAGAPLREPIARHGPFVMNTRAEIQTAFAEYQAGTFIKHKASMAVFK
jgi:hypothetical protein